MSYSIIQKKYINKRPWTSTYKKKLALMFLFHKKQIIASYDRKRCCKEDLLSFVISH